VEEPPLTLYQAEWCPFSSAVREVLTELGLDVVLRQAEPQPGQRERLRDVSGTDSIPVLIAEDGHAYRGIREIFGHLRGRDPWRFAAGHRRQFADHRDARETDVPGQLIEEFRGTGELEAAEREARPDDAVVTHAADANRYELRLDGSLIGLLSYRRRDDRIVFTHTEVSESCEGRGFGSKLAEAALQDARRQALAVVPLCPFIAWYIERHPEHAPLVAQGRQPPATGSPS
jgi:predicted GNAT family acetyltransferase/glutaredoxin